MKERLVELIDSFMDGIDVSHWYSEEYDEKLADYLIDNNIVAPPCKPGDEVYTIHYDMCILRCHGQCSRYCNGFDHYCQDYRGVMGILATSFDMSMIDSIGKTIFLTKEAAQLKIKEIEDEISCWRNANWKEQPENGR